MIETRPQPQSESAKAPFISSTARINELTFAAQHKLQPEALEHRSVTNARLLVHETATMNLDSEFEKLKSNSTRLGYALADVRRGNETRAKEIEAKFSEGLSKVDQLLRMQFEYSADFNKLCANQQSELKVPFDQQNLDSNDKSVITATVTKLKKEQETFRETRYKPILAQINETNAMLEQYQQTVDSVAPPGRREAVTTVPAAPKAPATYTGPSSPESGGSEFGKIIE